MEDNKEEPETAELCAETDDTPELTLEKVRPVKYQVDIGPGGLDIASEAVLL